MNEMSLVSNTRLQEVENGFALRLRSSHLLSAFIKIAVEWEVSFKIVSQINLFPETGTCNTVQYYCIRPSSTGFKVNPSAGFHGFILN